MEFCQISLCRLCRCFPKKEKLIIDTMAIYFLQMIAQASRLFGMSFDQEIIGISSVLLRYIFNRKHKEIYVKIYHVSKSLYVIKEKCWWLVP